jgi:hypothetical protein
MNNDTWTSFCQEFRCSRTPDYTSYAFTLSRHAFTRLSEGVQKKDVRGGANIRIANLYRYRKGYIRYSAPPYSIHRIAVSKRQTQLVSLKEIASNKTAGGPDATLGLLSCSYSFQLTFRRRRRVVLKRVVFRRVVLNS